MKRAVIFDMDGVIFDTERFFIECCRPAAEKTGLGDIDEVCLQCIGLRADETEQLLRDHFGPDAPLEEYQREAGRIFRSRYVEEGLPVKEGAREILKWLREQGARVALASSTQTEIVIEELERAELAEYFDVILGGDAVSRSKPAPDLFLKAAEMLGFAPENCYVIEDSLRGVRAAAAAGSMPLMVPDLEQPDEETRGLAKAVLPSLTEALSYLAEAEGDA